MDNFSRGRASRASVGLWVGYISKSFRYGQSVADVASMIISDEIFVKGRENISSVVGEFKEKNYTKIFRTNGALLEEAGLD